MPYGSKLFLHFFLHSATTLLYYSLMSETSLAPPTPLLDPDPDRVFRGTNAHTHALTLEHGAVADDLNRRTT